MSLRVTMTLYMDGAEVRRLPVTAGYVTFDSDEAIVTAAINELFHVAAFLEKNRPDQMLPEFNLLRVHLPDGTNVDVDGDLFLNAVIWDGLLKQGADPANVISDAKRHRAALDGLEASTEVALAKVITDAYIVVTSTIREVPTDA